MLVLPLVQSQELKSYLLLQKVTISSLQTTRITLRSLIEFQSQDYQQLRPRLVDLIQLVFLPIDLLLVGVGTSSSGVGTVGATGIVTYFKVTGDLNFPQIRENDILGIGSERVRVLNVDVLNSRIRVLRGVNGVVGASHTITTTFLEDPRKLTINAGFKTTYAPRRNRQIYFDPSESVGLGTATGVGIGSTIVFANPGAGLPRIDIPQKESTFLIMV